MALINTSVPNLIQGVSQQPDATRFAGQCEEQENALSSVADGLKKRPNTRHVARLLETAIDRDSFVHFVNRSEAEKYVLIHDGYCLKAWNMSTGNEASINGSTGGYTPASGSYLDAASPLEDIKGLTVADTTFILNTKKSVALNTERTDDAPTEALVFIKQGDYKKSYRVDIVVRTSAVTAADEATITANLVRYAHDVDVTNQWVGFSWRPVTTTTYRWRIDSLTIQDGGENYTSATASFSSNRDVYEDANFTLSLDASDGSIDGAIRVDAGGDYEGRGTTNATSFNNYNAEIGQLAPTITVTLDETFDSSSATTTALHAEIYSGSSASGSADSANTDNIASWLATNATNSGFGVSVSVPMNAANSAGNKVTDYFDVQRRGNIIKLTKKTNWIGDFTITTTDSLADSGMQAVYKSVATITDLPYKCFNGFKCKVSGDFELNQDDYYVEFKVNGESDFGDGSWVECAGFNIQKGFAASTMPFTLLNNDEDSFLLSETVFSDRTAGDETSNPDPSFVTNRITNIFFFKNRLGFLSRDNVIFSEAGLGGNNEEGVFSYNLYRNTVSSLLDSAPIDVSVSSRRVTTLEAAVGFQENLILFSRTGQFVLKGGDILTPKTISVIPATNFDYDAEVAPLPLGSYIYYPFKRGAFTGLREFTINASTDNYDSTEITEHVPAYIPSNIIQMKGTTSEDTVVLLSSDEFNALYIYNYFWNNNQKVLSAWSKFTFTGEIRGIEFIESTLYAVITNNGETNLVEMPLESGLKDNAGYVTHLDSRVSTTVDIGSSTITLPYTPEDNSVQVYTTDGLALNCTNSGSTVALSNPVSADTDVWVGIPYTMKYTFSEQLFKAKAGQGSSPSNAAKMMIRNGSLYYDNTSYFKVKVTPKFRDTYENVFTPDVVGSSTIGALSLDSGFYRFPVFTKPHDTTITIENESALPSTFQSAEFESFVHTRSNRYG
jgi:hypothetical protein